MRNLARSMNETKAVILVGNLTILSVIGAMYGFNQNSKLRSEENNRITIGDKTATWVERPRPWRTTSPDPASARSYVRTESAPAL